MRFYLCGASGFRLNQNKKLPEMLFQVVLRLFKRLSQKEAARTTPHHDTGLLSPAPARNNIETQHPLNEAEWFSYLAANPADISARLRLGEHLARDGRFVEARAQLQEALAVDSGNANIWNALGNVCRLESGTPQAQQCYLRAISLDPKLMSAHVNLASLQIQDGEIEQAEKLLRDTLASGLAPPEGFELLSQLYFNQKKLAQARPILEDGVQLHPTSVSLRVALATVLHKLAFHHEALGQLDKARFLSPDDPEIEIRRAMAFEALNRQDEAIDCYELAIKWKPSSEVHYQLAMAQLKSQRYEDARDNLEISCHIDATSALPFLGLGHVYRELRMHSDSLSYYLKAITLAPTSPDAYYYAGLAYYNLLDIDQSRLHLERALQLYPSMALAWAKLGVIDREQGLSDNALTKLHTAVAHDPNYLEAKCQIGVTHQDRGDFDTAGFWFDEVLARSPSYLQARWHKAYAELLAGNYESGWQLYEARLHVESMKIRRFPFPMWEGQELKDKTILIYSEQGLGDEIMFSSCFPDILRQAKRCFIECDVRLVSLFRRSFDKAEIFGEIGSKEIIMRAQQESIDFVHPAGSLPLFLRRHIHDFPKHTGYLFAEPSDRNEIRAQLAALGNGLKVGIAWRGGVAGTRAVVRSIPLLSWGTILNTKGTHFISLQYTECSQEIVAAQDQYGVTITQWKQNIDDLDQMAALISELDLVISVCTATAHMTGALGVPLWILAPATPEWRYGFKGTIMPWYPSARIFRQDRLQDWEELLNLVSLELSKFRDAKRLLGDV